jgi:hypothetical protein
MKTLPDGFRIATLLMALMLGWFAIATIFAETLTPKGQYFLQNPALGDATSYGWLVDFAAAAAPLRGDLLADIAMARAAPALRSDNAQASSEIVTARERALATARQSLLLSPHSSRMWLLTAMLQNRAQTRDSVAEALKMSYLTAPANVNLIPTRLAAVSASPAISDVELRSLARGDFRLILTRRPDLKPAIANAYRRGSGDGKAYIDEEVRLLDPGFAASLR